MNRRKVLGLTGAVAIALITAGVLFFSSFNTRLTKVPVVGALGKSFADPLSEAPAHVVVIVEENKAYGQIVGNVKDAPYLNSLIPRGALFTNSHAVAHPSQPNYMAIFSGRTNSDGDSCDVDGVPPDANNLGGELLKAKYSFVGYAESLPAVGFEGCYAGEYARKHAPWTHFSDIPPQDNRPFSDFPPYDRLPTVSFVIPNLLNDMHSGSIARGDEWLRTHLAPLIDWALTHDSLVIITWDEDNGTIVNHIPTLMIGEMVKPGQYDTGITHYNVLRTLETFYRLPFTGAASTAPPIENVWLPKRT